MNQKQIRITDLLFPHWFTLTLAFIAVVGESVTDLLDPWPLKIVFDYVFGSKRMSGWLVGVVGWIGTDKFSILNFAILAVLVIAIVGALSSYFEKYLTTSVGQWVMHDLRRVLYSHIQRLSLSFHDQKRTGDLISRVTSDIDAVQSLISNVLLGMLVNVLTLCGMIIVMFYLNWQFTLIALTVAPGLFLVVYYYTHRIKKASRAVRRKEGQVVNVLEEMLSSIRVVKAFAREDYEQERFEHESLKSVEAALAARNVKAKLAPIVEIIVACGTCLVLWYGARLVLTGALTPGEMLVFLLYLGKMYKPMRELSKMTDTISKAQIGWERIREVLENEMQVRDLPKAKRAPRFKGKIEFDHVDFSYDANQPVIGDLSFTIKPGQLAALVGPTGAGKTTIVSLLPRFYDLTAGQIRIDGTDIRQFKSRSLRQRISFVLQETLLFRATVAQNIAYGKPEATHAEIVRAAKLANAAEFIAKMPDGYDTMIGERGVTLSGGQRQRITIARAIIRDAPILILDEPSAGLDAESEKLVFDALGNLMEGRTSIVIAHRLATVRRADVIFVIDGGRLVEQGTHEELLENEGLYARLYELQFKGDEENAEELVTV
ncbi:MAG: ATP-binding cassette, subfamily bacterial [Blastocatellia bacterium]|jgi:subfamily B ATP-binding cassette protein MsbA|nr:ATP-binding cassette, subfamily bacterial [Blastocatellia bacterium]